MKKAPKRRIPKSAAMRGPIVLLTDFGDGYFQGLMKGVIAARAPEARIVDLCHHVRPGGVLEAAYVLEAAIPWFPKSSVFCCVVDPGVGTARRRIMVSLPGGPFAVGPDNGVLTALIIAKGAVIREITNGAWFANDDTKTFEGRSRFAPAAAALGAGAEPRAAGKAAAEPVVLELVRFRVTPSGIAGNVVYADSFGNLVTAIRGEDLDGLGARGSLEVSIGSLRGIPVRETYGDAADGETLAYVGSTGRLEIGIRGGNAARDLGADGLEVVVRRGGRERS